MTNSKSAKENSDEDKFQAQLKNIINHLKSINSIKLETEIITLLKVVLEQIFGSIDDIPPYEFLSPSHKKQLDKAIANLAKLLFKAGYFENKETALNYIIYTLSKTIFKKVSKKKEQKKEKELEYLTEQDKKKIAENLKKASFYKTYQILNPNRIAGETEADNIMHNILVGGVKLALQYADIEDIKSCFSKSFVKRLEEEHKAIEKNGGIRKLL
jgi:hypothetical protein